MKKVMPFLGAILLFAVLSLTSCGGSSKKNTTTDEEKEINTDTLAYLYGKWKYEEMGVAMNLEINSDKTFSWSSDFGSFNGNWSMANNLISFTPSDNLNPPFTLLKSNDGSLQEQTNNEVKPIYNKIK